MTKLSAIGLALALALTSSAHAYLPKSALGPNNGGVQINANSFAYYVGNNKALNWWQVGAQSWTIGSTGANNGLQSAAAWNATGTGGLSYFNPTTGEVANPAPADLTSITRTVFASSGFNPTGIVGPGGIPWYQNQRWDLQWCGTSVPSLGASSLGTGSTAMTIDSASVAGCPGTVGGTAHYIFGTNPGNVFLTFSVPNANSPPNSIFLWQHQYSADIAPCLAAPTTKRNCLNPDWLAQFGGFGIIRFMPDFETNISGISDYSQLADYSYSQILTGNMFSYSGPQWTTQTLPAVGSNGAAGPKGGVAPSVICDIVMRTGSHPHINLPFQANDTFAGLYATNLAACLRARQLVPRYEYCNEPWNFSGGFDCFYYENYQPWPPFGASAPYQQAITISAITPSASPTTITTATPHGFSPSNAICINVTSGTMSTALNFQTSVASVVDANNFRVNLNTTGLTFSAGTVYTCGTNVQWAAYRAAQHMQKIRTALGTDSGNGWRGTINGQMVSPGSWTSILTGINFFITNEAPAGTTVNKLFSEVVVAPYWGNATVDGNTISNLTNAATPTITFSCNVGAQVCPTTGSQIRIYAASGMTQINNMTATITCSPCTSTGTINIDTSAMSAWNTANGGANQGNFFISNILPKMADDSVTLNGSTPATYPTKYSYFTQEMADSIINGTATNSGYVTSNSYNLTAAGLAANMNTWALQANSYGLDLRQYEGGNTFAYVNNGGLPCYIGCTSNTTTLYDFMSNWHYDAGTATHGMQELLTKSFQIYEAVNGAYPSQFLNTGGGAAPFNETRFFPGDSGTNWNWIPVASKNAQGPYVDPTAATSATCAQIGTGGLSSGSSATSTSFSADIGAAVAPYVVVFVSQNGGTFGTPTVTVGGVSLTQIDTFNNAGVSSSAYGGVVTGLSGVQTVAITFDAASGFRDRPVYAFTSANLNSKSVLSHAAGNSGGFTLNYTKNGCILAGGIGGNSWTSVSGSATLASGTPGQSPNPTTYTTYTRTVPSGDAMVGKSTFSSSIFRIQDGGNGGSITAVELR